MIFKTLGEVCDKGDADVQTGPFGSQLHESDYVDEGVPVVMPKDIHDGRIDEDGVARVTEHKASTLPRHFLQAGDIVMPRRGEISKRALITEEQSGYLCGTGCVRIRLSNGSVHPRFLYYYLDQPHIIQWIEQRAIGSTMLNLNTSIVKAIPLPPIPYDTQRRIATVLSSYDDLIANNRKRIKLLERAARLLYTEWFVRGRFPGHQGVKVKDGVPEGWEKGKIEDFYYTSSGGTPSRSKPEYYEGDINWVKTQELNEDFILEAEEKITELAIKNSSAKVYPPNTLLVSMYGGTNIGRAALLGTSAACNQACCALLPKVKHASVHHAFLFFGTMREQLISISQGAAQTNISQQIVKGLDYTLPSEPVMRAFSARVLPLFDQMRTLQAMNRQLTRARDLLLPRLMSGKVKV